MKWSGKIRNTHTVYVGRKMSLRLAVFRLLPRLNIPNVILGKWDKSLCSKSVTILVVLKPSVYSFVNEHDGSRICMCIFILIQINRKKLERHLHWALFLLVKALGSYWLVALVLYDDSWQSFVPTYLHVICLVAKYICNLEISIIWGNFKGPVCEI